MRWSAIWQDGWPLVAPAAPEHLSRPLPGMTLCLECVMPPRSPRQALRLWQGQGAGAVALYLTSEGALRLIHGELDLQTGADFARAGETVLLHYRACARGRDDFALFRNADRDMQQRLRAAIAHPIRAQDAMPRDPRFLSICHVAAIAPFGIGSPDLPGLSGDAPVATPDGPRPVSTLTPGDLVITETGTPQPLQWIEARPRLSLGRLAPVRLKAPYFGLRADLIVTPQTRIQRTGPTVEYIFGEDAVLVRARDLVGGPAALHDRRAPVRQVYHLMLDDRACLRVDRCTVETAALDDVVTAEGLVPRAGLGQTDGDRLTTLDRAGAQALASATLARRAAG